MATGDSDDHGVNDGGELTNGTDPITLIAIGEVVSDGE